MAFGRKKKEEQALNLVQNGARGIGTVLTVQDTGMSINDNPRVKMTFRVEPIDGSPPFEAQKTKVVSRVEIPRTGDRYPVWYDAADPGETWAFAMIADDTGRAQIRQMFGPQAESITGMGGSPFAAAPAPAPAAAPAADPVERLRKLDELRSSGILSDAEFEQKKAEILAQI
jgi:Short C-terminal domain